MTGVSENPDKEKIKKRKVYTLPKDVLK
jgi:hypothetical protein